MPTVDERVSFLEGRMAEQSTILQNIQQSVASLDDRVQQSIASLDGRMQHSMASLDSRMQQGFVRLDGRIDNPSAGWKGRGLWSANGTRAVWHTETGMGTRGQIVHFQLRPDPLAK